MIRSLPDEKLKIKKDTSSEFWQVEGKIIITKDGSNTISVFIQEMNVTYHSIYGSIRESMHVFIDAGLKNISPPVNGNISIFEMGFGTGLNALLTLAEAEKLHQKISYVTVELNPLRPEEALPLNYCEQLNRKDLQPVFNQLHQCEWEKDISITPFFTIHKANCNLINFSTCEQFQLVYFDAFAPAVQPPFMD